MKTVIDVDLRDGLAVACEGLPNGDLRVILETQDAFVRLQVGIKSLLGDEIIQAMFDHQKTN